MDSLVARQNIERYRQMLKITPDPARRRLIEKLLLEEEAKLEKYEEDHKRRRSRGLATSSIRNERGRQKKKPQEGWS